MDIFSHLKQEHDQIREMMEDIECAGDAPDERIELLVRLREEILTHVRGEEATFYQELENRAELREMIRDAKEEHSDAEELLDELQAISVHDIEWSERFELLRDSIESHMDDEETTIFEHAKGLLDANDSERIFSRMRTAEEQFRTSL